MALFQDCWSNRHSTLTLLQQLLEYVDGLVLILLRVQTHIAH